MARLRRQAPDVAEYVYHWRSSMEYFMMKHFRLCLALLENKFDAVGAGLRSIHAAADGLLVVLDVVLNTLCMQYCQQAWCSFAA